MKTQDLEKDQVKQAVREQYGRIAEQARPCGCAPSCCNPAVSATEKSHDPTGIAQNLGYSAEEVSTVPEGSNLGLGCGNPQAIATIKPGETVLDLGSGAGFDVFLAARAVGPAGAVIGVEMTPGMISRARKNKSSGGYDQVEFRLGEIENLPVADTSVDVIVSNCVINLSPDKARVFREAFRVLNPGGRLAISDIVSLAPIPEELRHDWELYTGCVAGAAPVGELEGMLKEAGFVDIRIAAKLGSSDLIQGWFPHRKAEEYVASATIEAVKPGLH